MDEFQKIEARNYAVMAGFFVIGVLALLTLFGTFSETMTVAFTPEFYWIIALVFIIIGIFLAVIEKRGMSSIFFIGLGMFCFIESFVSGTIFLGVFGVFTLLMLFGKDKKKIIYFLTGLIFFAASLFRYLNLPSIVFQILCAVMVVFAFWFAFASAAERIGFPGHKLITNPEVIDFKSSGSALGYFTIAMVCALWTCYYLLSENFVPLEAVMAFKFAASLLLILLAVMLFAIAKMRFTPIVFLLFGFILFSSLFITGPAMIALGIPVILLGLIALVRKESRALVALLLIIYGLTFFISVMITGNYELGIFNAILNAIPAVIAFFLAFAVFAQAKKVLV